MNLFFADVRKKYNMFSGRALNKFFVLLRFEYTRVENISTSFSTHFLTNFGVFGDFSLFWRFVSTMIETNYGVRFFLKASSNIGLSNEAGVRGGSKTLLSYNVFKNRFENPPFLTFIRELVLLKVFSKTKMGFSMVNIVFNTITTLSTTFSRKNTS